jgi:hypothetical protein
MIDYLISVTDSLPPTTPVTMQPDGLLCETRHACATTSYSSQHAGSRRAGRL